MDILPKISYQYFPNFHSDIDFFRNCLLDNFYIAISISIFLCAFSFFDIFVLGGGWLVCWLCVAQKQETCAIIQMRSQHVSPLSESNIPQKIITRARSKNVLLFSKFDLNGNFGKSTKKTFPVSRLNPVMYFRQVLRTKSASCNGLDGSPAHALPKLQKIQN